MSVAGAAIAGAALAKGALTVGLLAGGADAYWEGTDILGAELPPVQKPVVEEIRINTGNYYTQVAAGLTVVALWSLINYLTPRRRT